MIRKRSPIRKTWLWKEELLIWTWMRLQHCLTLKWCSNGTESAITRCVKLSLARWHTTLMCSCWTQNKKWGTRVVPKARQLATQTNRKVIRVALWWYRTVWSTLGCRKKRSWNNQTRKNPARWWNCCRDRSSARQLRGGTRCSRMTLWY
jgi:hypothetical protein